MFIYVIQYMLTLEPECSKQKKKVTEIFFFFNFSFQSLNLFEKKHFFLSIYNKCIQHQPRGKFPSKQLDTQCVIEAIWKKLLESLYASICFFFFLNWPQANTDSFKVGVNICYILVKLIKFVIKNETKWVLLASK